MKRILVLCLVVCFSVVGISGVASAATRAGDSTIMGTLSYDADNFSTESGGDVDMSIFSAAIGVGRFFTDNFEAEIGLIGQTITIDEGSGSETLQQMGLQVRPNFHFNTASNTVPYLGLTLGYLWVDLFGGDGSGFMYGGQAGIKQFVSENSYLQFELGYTASDLEIEDTDVALGDFRFSLGVGYKF